MSEATMKSRLLVGMTTAMVLASYSMVFAQVPSAAPAAAPPAASAAPAAPAATTANPQDFDYKLGAGDKIRVIVFDEPKLSGEFFVSGSGIVSFPLIGDINATGMGLETFRATLQSKLGAGYLKDPRVSVEVLTYRPFYILGEVTKPGEYPYSSGLSVLKAVATAGGFTYRAQTKRVFIRHINGSKEEQITISNDTPVQPGDTIRIAERYF